MQQPGMPMQPEPKNLIRNYRNCNEKAIVQCSAGVGLAGTSMSLMQKTRSGR